MKTSRAEPGVGSATLLVFAGMGPAGGWRLLDGDGAMIGRGAALDDLPAPPERTILAVRGDQVALHWLDLADGLAPAQAAAAARLLLADASAETLANLHVAVGRAERGLTPVALVPHDCMRQWLADAGAAGLDPDALVPAPMLLDPPEAGFARRDLGERSDYRGGAAAFTLEPELAGEVVAGAPVESVDEPAFEARLGAILAAPPIDLRQGPYAKRRRWKLDGRNLRRVVALAIALVALSLAVQLATILSYTFAADRLRAEADALSARAPGAAAAPAFGPAANVLFDAVRATPNVEIVRLEFAVDGSLGVTVAIDGPATLGLLRERIEAGGLSVVPGGSRNDRGRPVSDLTVRPA
ncbi:MAG: type II secretion system protein GspL [Allosphingosinicella sp.]